MLKYDSVTTNARPGPRPRSALSTAATSRCGTIAALARDRRIPSMIDA